MEIGEQMSKVTNLDHVVEGIGGEVYENHTKLTLGQPMDIGRTLYVKAVKSLPGKVEVWWDHYAAQLRIECTVEGHTVIRTVYEEEIEQAQRLDRIIQIIRAIESEVNKWQQ